VAPVNRPQKLAWQRADCDVKNNGIIPAINDA
jgi:hypothetical protein